MNEMLPAPKRATALSLSGKGRAALVVLDAPLREAANVIAVARASYEQTLTVAPVRDLASAIAARRELWPRACEVRDAELTLKFMLERDPGERYAVTEREAAGMFALVHGALRRRSGDPEHEALWLHSIVRLFTGDGDPLASFTDKLPRHRNVVALTAQRILDTAPFLPMPAEVREVVWKVNREVAKLHGYTRDWLNLAQRAEVIVFQQDRASWEAAYTPQAVDRLEALQSGAADRDLDAAYDALSTKFGL